MKTIEALAIGSLLALVTVGCSSATSNDGESLGSSQDQLVSDNEEASNTDADLEVGVDDSLSGAGVADPGTPALDDLDAARLEKVRVNAQAFFQPAGCLTTTVRGNVAMHVFVNCTGPYGLKTFNGTLTSTWAKADGTLTVTHAATDFSINGATISGSRIVTYTKSGNVITKHRTGDWSGTTASGKILDHTADFTSTWNPSTLCVTRDGSSHSQIGGRELDTTVTGYKRCGIGNLGCPESGQITLTRTKGDKTNQVTVDFVGGRKVKVTGPGGGAATRAMVCRAAS